MEPITRAEHLNWAKERALQYVKLGKYADAINSLTSDLTKHPETRNHSAIELSMTYRINGWLKDATSIAKFIQDCQ